MSASREKKIRQDQTSTGWIDPKSTRNTEASKAQKRSSALYTVIAVVFLLVAIAAVVWRSNIIPKTATAATIDGESYKVNEVSFYYHNTVSGFMTQETYQILGMLGVNLNAPLENQVITENVAGFLGVEEEGLTFRDYFMQETLKHMAAIDDVLATAEAENFVYPDSVQADYDEAMANLKAAAGTSGASVKAYLQNMLGRTMTENVYGEQVMRMLKYGAYMTAYMDSLNYTDEDLLAEYNADPKVYDKVSYESISFSGTPEAKTDADGNPVEATEEETAAAKAEAKAAAEKALADYKAGSKLEELSKDLEKASYSNNEKAAYTSGVITDWLFDDVRKAGDATVLENGTAYALVVFHERFREDYDTIDVRHILITPEQGTLSSEDEGYKDEQESLKAAAHAKAEEILAQWTSGEATEASFAQLAKENSADSNAAQGGIYEMVAPGDMVDTFNDWCFDDARKAGDTGVVDTPYGSHVMYFVGTNLPKWEADVTNVLTNRDFNEWADQYGKDAAIEVHSFGAKFVA